MQFLDKIRHDKIFIGIKRVNKGFKFCHIAQSASLPYYKLSDQNSKRIYKSGLNDSLR